MKPALLNMGLAPRTADILAKAGPVGAVVVTTLITFLFDLSSQGIKIVGTVPMGLPPSQHPVFHQHFGVSC